MTLRLYSTYKALRREQAPSKAAQSIQSSVCHALVLLGMGIEGMSCGGDVTLSGKR